MARQQNSAVAVQLYIQAQSQGQEQRVCSSAGQGGSPLAPCDAELKAQG